MAAPTSLLRGARAFARDMPRDSMTAGYLWDIADYVPAMIDSQLTSRGAWTWGTNPIDSDYSAGILASFTAGEQVLATGGTPTLWQIDAAGSTINRGPCPVGRQNPVQLFDETIWFEQSGAHVPFVARATGTPVGISGAPNAKVGAIWKAYVICGGAPGSEDTLYFSPPYDVSLAWDAASIVRTSQAITGLAGLRSIILVFHAGTVERIRGSTPPVTGAPEANDLVLEPLFSQAGTTEPKSICYWNENVIFADEHGVHMTDGSVIRNLVSQGSISSYWRPLYSVKQRLAACVFLDYYIISIIRTDGGSVTLVCDLNKRQWFRFTNIAATSMWASGGTLGTERLWGGIQGTNRGARLSTCFFPPASASPAQDANGVYVLPSFETPYYKLGDEGRKRVRFVYLSYDARTGAALLRDDHAQSWRLGQFPDEDDTVTQFVAPEQQAVTPSVLQCNYILSPQDASWTLAGGYPSTSKYTRWRLPVGKFPYGIAFQVKQLQPTTVTRINDLAVEAHAAERSRV